MSMQRAGRQEFPGGAPLRGTSGATGFPARKLLRITAVTSLLETLKKDRPHEHSAQNHHTPCLLPDPL